MRAICSICSGGIEASMDAMPSIDAGAACGTTGCAAGAAEETAPRAAAVLPDTAGSGSEALTAAAGLRNEK